VLVRVLGALFDQADAAFGIDEGAFLSPHRRRARRGSARVGSFSCSVEILHDEEIELLQQCVEFALLHHECDEFVAMTQSPRIFPSSILGRFDRRPCLAGWGCFHRECRGSSRLCAVRFVCRIMPAEEAGDVA
jgi:hypothetical protein